MVISKYTEENEEDVISSISKDSDWDMFTKGEALDLYKESLKNSVTYVCYKDKEFCGYIRAILDDGFAVYVSELYVLPEYRNIKIGQSLLEEVNDCYPHLTFYILSDEDAYYDKKGYKKIGSIFKR